MGFAATGTTGHEPVDQSTDVVQLLEFLADHSSSPGSSILSRMTVLGSPFFPVPMISISLLSCIPLKACFHNVVPVLAACSLCVKSRTGTEPMDSINSAR